MTLAAGRVSRAVGATAMGLGATVLVGWALNLRAVLQVAPGSVAMAPNTAVAFVLVGLSLWLQVGRAGSQRRVALAFAALAGFLGIAELAQFGFDVDLGLDQALFRDPASLTGATPGRMAVLTAFGFTCIAAALLCSGRRRARRVADALAIVPGVLAILSLVAYGFGVGGFQWVGRYSGMAIHTAAGLVLLSIAALTARPDSPLLGLVTSGSAGGLTVRRVLPLAVGIPVVIGWMVLRAESAGLFKSDKGQVLHVIATIVFTAVVIGWQGAVLDRIDRDRQRSAQYARNLLEASPDPLVAIGPDGRVSDVNEATVQATGVSRENLAGSLFAGYFTEPDKAEAVYKLVLAEGEVRDFPLTLRHAAGPMIDVLYNATVYRDVSGAVRGVLAAARDVTEPKRAEKALQASEDKFRHFFEYSVVGMSQTFTSGEIRVNKAFAQMLGYTFDEMNGAPWRRIIHPEDTQLTEDHLQSLLDGTRESTRFDLRYLHKDGSIVWGDLSTALRRDAGGRPLYFMTAVLDITERRRAADEVRALNAQLEERVRERTAKLEAANKDLEAFSYSVSHDLRTPLRAIDGYSRMLLEDYADRLDAEGNRLLAVVRSSTRRMARLIDDLLDFSRVGRKGLSRTTVDMTSLARAAFDEVRTGPEEVSFSMGSLPAADGDPGLLKQVWVNLISNALKFTGPKAERVVAIEGRSEAERLVYSVKDNGVGFDMAYAHKLFGVFQRLHSDSEFEGTGVGLALVQRIVHRHGGAVWAEGKVGSGAIFSFSLPRPEAPHE